MATKWRYAVAEVETKNVARVTSVSFRMGARPVVIIGYEIGDDSSGTFVAKKQDHLEMEAPLPAAVVTLIENINTRAFAYLVNKGIIPAGVEETEVEPVSPTR